MTDLYSTEIDGIGKAAFQLVVDNASHLIKYIYDNKNTKPYSDPEIRVGLVIKILIKSDTSYATGLLKPVIDDLEYLLSDREYLQKFKDPVAKREALSKELSLLNRFLELDETMSLNTLHQLPVKGVL